MFLIVFESAFLIFNDAKFELTRVYIMHMLLCYFLQLKKERYVHLRIRLFRVIDCLSESRMRIFFYSRKTMKYTHVNLISIFIL
jgi:hypothetical protein